MSFWIYHCDDNRYSQRTPIKLTGFDGLLAQFLTGNSAEETPFTWELSDRDIIKIAQPNLESKDHCLIFDMMPEAHDEVSLYRISHLQGCSELDESDVVLACHILYQARTPGRASSIKQSFSLEQPESKRQMLEALHLTGGTLRGKYFWAKPKMNIGAAVCPSSI